MVAEQPAIQYHNCVLGRSSRISGFAGQMNGEPTRGNQRRSRPDSFSPPPRPKTNIVREPLYLFQLFAIEIPGISRIQRTKDHDAKTIWRTLVHIFSPKTRRTTSGSATDPADSSWSWNILSDGPPGCVRSRSRAALMIAHPVA